MGPGGTRARPTHHAQGCRGKGCRACDLSVAETILRELGAEGGCMKQFFLRYWATSAWICLGIAICLGAALRARAQGAAPATNSATFLGSIQTIDGRVLSVKNDAGASMQVTVGEQARLIRVAPGQKTLAGASAVNFSDLQAGDRILARGAPGPGGAGIDASLVVVMKSADIAQKHAEESEDWRRHGVGGLVTAVDPSAGTVTLSGGPGRPSLLIRISTATVIRRYAPGSVKFSDATPAPLSATKVGDQLIARGARSADGHTIDAVEIVSGAFRNFSGSVTAVDPAASTVTIMDLAGKRPVVLNIAADTSMKALDPATAQRIATVLKGGAAGPPARVSGSQPGPPARIPGGPGNRSDSQGIQPLLARAPSVGLDGLHKGDVVMAVAMQGKTPGTFTAVTLVSGVAPMLQASASGSQSLLSASWNVGGGAAAGGDASGGGGQQGP